MNNQRGLTLVELLVAIIIFSFVAIFATSILINSLKTYSKISADTILRDEADLIIATLIKEIYTTKDSETSFKEEPIQNNYYIYRNDDPTLITGFKDNKIYINGTEFKFNDRQIEVIWGKSTIELLGNSNLDRTYHINLTMKSKKKNIEKTFKSEVRSINDLIKEEEEEA